MSLSAADTAEEVAALSGLNLEALREVWRLRYGHRTSLRSADFLRHQLAWRIQAETYGGLDEATAAALTTQVRAKRGPNLQVGTRLAREWKGVRVEVEVTHEGFRSAGVDYASLSELARAVTGVRWNGPRFFGLRAEAGHAS